MRTLGGTESLRDALSAFEGGRIVVLTAAPAYKCLGSTLRSRQADRRPIRQKGLAGPLPVDFFAAEPGR
ncbi:MAG TPA: hypothetical protein VE569_07195 [Acidimicrobiia bacterium]|nr:hypothetical protein [Acidimicrobiia bacterium]